MDIAVKQEEAREDGRQEKAIEAAKNAIELGLTTEQIMKITGLPQDQIKELVKEEYI